MSARSFERLAIPVDAHVYVDGNVLIVTKWEWDFAECLDFQKRAQKLVAEERSLKVYIFCNHPHCFTLGRGNERGQDNLVEHSLQEHQLEFPFHRIHRGGGLTFHYPGQWIFYPIVALSPKYSLTDHTCWLLKSCKKSLTDGLGIDEVVTANKLMGVWRHKRKLASIGVGVSRFVTEHGLALNLTYDEKMFTALSRVFPCGIDSSVYQAVDQLDDVGEKVLKADLLQKFHQTFLQSL